MPLTAQTLHFVRHTILLLVLLRQAFAGELHNAEELRRLKWEQLVRIKMAELDCNRTLSVAVRPKDGVYCDAVFDDILCWPYTPADELASQPCPAFIINFNPAETATRQCQGDGEWGPPPPDVNRTNSSSGQQGWTNFTSCSMPPATPVMPRFVPLLIKEHMPVITLISKVGYSISLILLVVATTIMITIKRLHCQRNVIHINLFITFMIRAVICLLRDSLLVQGLGLPQDVQYDKDGDIEFNPHGPHWECKLLLTLFYWALTSNYMWIFVEGLYLHTLIFFAVFNQKVIFKWYIIIGWTTPFLFVIPWVLVRIFLNNTLCWNTHEHGYYWILNGPIVVSISVNFFFFLNIVRVLFTKIRASTTEDSKRHRKMAKSTLVLIPLFGVYYIFFIISTNHSLSHPGLEVGLFYAEMTINSFQGTVVAILFCFTNGEVRHELLKKWQRQRLRRQSVASMRSSRAMSTTSFFLKERTSISQGGGGPSRRGSKFPNVESCLSLRSMESNGAVPGAGAGGGKGTIFRFPRVDTSPNLRNNNNNSGSLNGGGGGGGVGDLANGGPVYRGTTRERERDLISADFPSPTQPRQQRDGVLKVARFHAVDSNLSLRSLDSNNSGAPASSNVTFSNSAAAAGSNPNANASAGVNKVVDFDVSASLPPVSKLTAANGRGQQHEASLLKSQSQGNGKMTSVDKPGAVVVGDRVGDGGGGNGGRGGDGASFADGPTTRNGVGVMTLGGGSVSAQETSAAEHCQGAVGERDATESTPMLGDDSFCL